MNSLLVLPAKTPMQSQNSTTKKSARRCLFGRPDHEKVNKWLSDRLEEMRAEQIEKWGFDFSAEIPCASATSDFIFTSVPADSVPHFYRQSYYKGDSLNNSDIENRTPDSDSDCSMEEPCLQSLPRFVDTPKKQTKLTAYLQVHSRKRLLRHAKTDDLKSPKGSGSKSMPFGRRFKTVSQ